MLISLSFTISFNLLGGGFIFTPILYGEDSHFDEHIFQMGWFNHQPTNLRCDSSSSTERCISAWDELLIKHDVFFEPTNGRGIDSFDKYMVKKHPLKRAMLMAVSSIGCGIRPQDMIHHSTAYD